MPLSFLKSLFQTEKVNTPELKPFEDIKTENILKTTLISVPNFDFLKATEKLILTKWFKTNNDIILKGDVICELETSKNTLEFESFETGVLEICKEENSDLKEGEIIAKIHFLKQ